MMLGVLTIIGKGKAGSAVYSASVAGGGTCAWPGVGVRGGAGQLARRTLMDPYFSRCADFLILRAFSLAQQGQANPALSSCPCRNLPDAQGRPGVGAGERERESECVSKGLHLSPLALVKGKDSPTEDACWSGVNLNVRLSQPNCLL